jgi:minor extracellular serine protease Vpr
MRHTILLLVTLLISGAAWSAPLTSRGWVVILKEPSVLEWHPGRAEATVAVVRPYRDHLRQVQAGLRAQMEGMHVHVTGAVQHVLNAMFVRATPAQAAALRQLPGVKLVLPSRRFRKADQLSMSQVQAAWNVLGGQGNAGKGIKIGMIDTGIDQTHPSFQDPSLPMPAGFPKCDVQYNCDHFTSNKVIVARAYIDPYLTAGSNPSDPAADSRPDVTTAQDLDGHGTATASVAAGVPVSSQGISGVAPHAYLGNYKVFGSPEVNNSATDAGIIQALDDAVTDGMDVVNLSLGVPAFGGPLDTDPTCTNFLSPPPSGPVSFPFDACDPTAYAVENAMRNGQVVVVAAAGNEGATGYQNGVNGAATFGTLSSPADAPSAIAAGGLQNDISYAQSVQITGHSVPSNLADIAAFQSPTGPVPPAPLTAPLADVTQLGNSDGLLCSGLPGTPMNGDIALILRGTCQFSNKVLNAQAAGAIGVIFIDNGNGVGKWGGGLQNTQIPAFILQQSDGQNLKTYIDANAGAKATMNPAMHQVASSLLGFIPFSVASFASRGPSTGINGLKPDLTAAATDFLLAAENLDPYGDLYSETRYATAAGTSFSSPTIAGAAALVKQTNTHLTPLQIKSALVNTATLSGLLTQDGGANPSLVEVGAGLLQAQKAVISSVQVTPSSVSFGLLSGSLPGAQSLAVSNTGAGAVNLALAVNALVPAAGTSVTVSPASLTLAPGATGNVTVSLSGGVPAPGRYEGLITVTGGPTPLNVPYMFLVGDNTPYDVIPVYGQYFDGPINQQLPPGEGPFIIRVIDRYGAPVSNASVAWADTTGDNGYIVSGIQNTATTTDINGVAYATPNLGSTVGTQSFTATVNGMTVPFDGNARVTPAINPGGIVDAASGKFSAVAPGSWISIYGTNLSDYTDNAFSVPFPLGIDYVAFSFDAGCASGTCAVSVPGRFQFVSPDQLNVLVPWELAGQTSATVKVIINYTYSAEYTLQLASYSPGIFLNYGATVNGQVIAAALDGHNQVLSSGNPIARGDTVQLFLNGLGPVNNQDQLVTGYPAPLNTAQTTTTAPVITIGGQTATLAYYGLAPGLVGTYQVNAVVPSTIGTGLQTVTCSIGGASAKTVMIPVK